MDAMSGTGKSLESLLSSGGPGLNLNSVRGYLNRHKPQNVKTIDEHFNNSPLDEQRKMLEDVRETRARHLGESEIDGDRDDEASRDVRILDAALKALNKK